MHLWEALKSGKRFRRIGWKKWYLPREMICFTTEDFEADDFEIEEDPKPRRLTYICIEPGLDFYEMIRVTTRPLDTFNAAWERFPCSLDEPESKTCDVSGAEIK